MEDQVTQHQLTHMDDHYRQLLKARLGIQRRMRRPAVAIWFDTELDDFLLRQE